MNPTISGLSWWEAAVASVTPGPLLPLIQASFHAQRQMIFIYQPKLETPYLLYGVNCPEHGVNRSAMLSLLAPPAWAA